METGKDNNKEEEVKPKKTLFAETSVSNNAQNYVPTINKYSAQEVVELLENPYKNANTLQQVSRWMYYNSGIYNRLINNFSGMNIYDLYLFPNMISKYSKKKVDTDKLYKEYLDIASLVEKINHKSNFRQIGTNLLIQGEVYLFKVETSDGIIYKEIPSDYCKISKVINDGLYKYSINMSKLGTEANYSMMPTQIQDLYNKHKAGTLSDDLYTESNYVLMDGKEAVCLSTNLQVSTKSIPPLSYIFPSLIRLMDEEINEIEENKANNLKLIHMKYNLDDEGEPMIDEVNLSKMHASAKANLPSGVAINTNPLEVTTHTLQRTGNVSASNRQTLTELVYNNSGVNSELFNGDNSNNQAILTGVIADETYIDILNNIFENYIKYEIKNKKKNSLWLPRFVRNTKYNETTVSDNAFKGATVGLSRLKLMATQHYSPLEALSILEFETENGIDELFVPLATAYTQSSNVESEGGRTKVSKDDSNSKGVGENPNSTNQ